MSSPIGRKHLSDTASVLSSTVGSEFDVPPPYIVSSSLNESLLIGQSSIESLRERIVGIQEETQALRIKFKNLHTEKKKLFKEKKQRKGIIAEQESRCEDLQMLKFGQTIDLESLDKIGDRKALDQVNRKKRKLEVRNEAAIAKARKSISTAQESLIKTTQENTSLLERIAHLTHQQQTLERDLNVGGNRLNGADQAGVMRKDAEERNRLVQLVKLQAKEVDALKAEINMLRRKGGHVYTPAISVATPPVGTAGSMGMDSNMSLEMNSNAVPEQNW